MENGLTDSSLPDHLRESAAQAPDASPTPTHAPSDEKSSQITEITGKVESVNTKVLPTRPAEIHRERPHNIKDFVASVLTTALEATASDSEARLSDEDEQWVSAIAQLFDADPRSRDLFVTGMDFDTALPTPAPAVNDVPAGAPQDLDAIARMLNDAWRNAPSTATASRPKAPTPDAGTPAASDEATRPGIPTPVEDRATRRDLAQAETAAAISGGAAPDTTEAPIRELAPAVTPVQDALPTAQNPLLGVMEMVRNLDGEAGLDRLRQAIEKNAPAEQRAEALSTFDRMRPTLRGPSTGRPSAASLGDRRAMRGGFEEVALEGSITLRDHPADPDFALQYTVSQLAPTIERLELKGSKTSPEQLVSLVVHWFAGEPVYARGRRPTASPQFREVLNRLRALLLDAAHRQMRAESSSSPALALLETVTNVITWYGMASGEPEEEAAAQLSATAFALESLDMFLHASGDPARVGRMLSQLANNASGWISQTLGLSRDEDLAPAETAAQLNTLHSLGTVAHLRQPHSGAWNDRARLLFEALGVSADLSGDVGIPEELRWTYAARAMLFMSNIPSAWREVGAVLQDLRAEMPTPFSSPKACTRYRTAVLAGLSAVVRAQFNPPQNADEITAALFNMGVDVLTMKRTFPDLQGSAVLRILANGLGLVWALAQDEDGPTLLDDLNAGDCAVNFFGALADAEVRDFAQERDTARVLRPLLEAFISEGRQPARLASNMSVMRARLEGSFGVLFGQDESPRPVAFDRLQLRSQCVKVLHIALNRWGTEGDGLSDLRASVESLGHALDDFAITCARCLRWGFNRLRSEDGDGHSPTFVPMATWWTRIAWRLGRLSREADYEAFIGQVPTNFDAWGIDVVAEAYRDDIGPHLLSTTLGDARLMAPFFGANAPPA